MRSVVVKPGEKAELVERDRPVPELGPHEVLIRVRAASLNYRDQAVLDGIYPGSQDEVTPLSDGAGEVAAIGPKVSRAKIGDRVSINCFQQWIGGPFLPEYMTSSTGFAVDGWLSEYIAVPESAIVQLPGYMSWVEGASLACAAATAWSALNRAGPFRPGQRVLVQGTGGVSLFALQIAKALGGRVLAITSSDEKAERLKELGAEGVVNYNREPEWAPRIVEMTNGHGVDKVVEIAGDKTIAQSVASTRIGGDVALVGFASGFGGGVAPIEILARSMTVGGTSIGSRLSFEELLAAMEAYRIKPVIDSVHPFADYRRAYERLASGQMVGKVVIELPAGS